MKKTLKIIASVLIISILLSVTSFSVSQSGNFITNSKTPVYSSVLKYSVTLGQGYKNAPTSPIVIGNTLIVASANRLFKLNAENGKVLQSSVMSGSVSFSVASPTYADGKIFVQLGGGKIQAFDYNTMKSIWVYTDAVGGQALCPITYESGYIYTGFWISEEDSANYVCISTNDENPSSENESKKAKWTFKNKGGFYLSGSAVSGNYVLLGADNGLADYTGSSKIFALNKSTGKLASSLAVKGDIRSSITYDSVLDTFFVSSKAGYVYSFKFSSSTGTFSALKSFKAIGSVTSSPVCYKGRLYFGSQNASSGRFYVLDASTMKEIYHAEMKGYPQATPLVGTGFEKEGSVLVYLTYNQRPGGITLFEDSAKQTEAKMTEIFEPTGTQSQFCISPIVADEDGTLFYKNDSGTIFAVGQKKYDIKGLIQKIIQRIVSILKKSIGVK